MTSKIRAALTGLSVRALLADLDDTLFDHSYATSQALGVLHAEVPAFGGWAREELVARHHVILEEIHQAVLAGRVTIDVARITRFQRLLDAAGAPSDASREARDGDAAHVARIYRERYEAAWQPVPGALALAAEVRRAGVGLIIVTNNVTREQELKLRHCGLMPYVDALITSESTSATKPDPRIFEAALAAARVPAAEAVMLGDSWSTDIAGARAAGVRPVWFNPTRAPAPAGAAACEELQALEPLADVWRMLMGAPRT